MPHPADDLWRAISAVEPYPPSVVPVPERLPFTAFFPGGAGLILDENRALPPMPTRGILILGHNFYNLAGFEAMRARNREDARTPTWRNLLSTLRRAELDPRQCFFSNAYMGLIDGPSAQGKFPGASDAGFVARCREFLLMHLRVVQPRLIVTLGVWVPPFLAPLSPVLEAAWLDSRGRYRGLQVLDAEGASLMPSVRFEGVSEAASVAVLTHPAQQWPNVRRRRWRGLESYEAERELLREAWAGAST